MVPSLEEVSSIIREIRVPGSQIELTGRVEYIEGFPGVAFVRVINDKR